MRKKDLFYPATKLFTEESFSSIVALLRQVTSCVKLDETQNGACSRQIAPNMLKGTKSVQFRKHGFWAPTKCCYRCSRKQRLQCMHLFSADEMTSTCVVEYKEWINTAFKALKKCWYLVRSERKKSEVTMDFKCRHCSLLCSRRKTKLTCVVHPSRFGNEIIAVDKLSLSKTLKGLIRS